MRPCSHFLFAAEEETDVVSTESGHQRRKKAGLHLSKEGHKISLLVKIFLRHAVHALSQHIHTQATLWESSWPLSYSHWVHVSLNLQGLQSVSLFWAPGSPCGHSPFPPWWDVLPFHPAGFSGTYSPGPRWHTLQQTISKVMANIQLISYKVECKGLLKGWRAKNSFST